MTQTCNGLNLKLCKLLGNPKFAPAQVAKRDGTSARDHATSSLLRYQGKKDNKGKQYPKSCRKNVETIIAIIAGHWWSILTNNKCLYICPLTNFWVLLYN